MNEKENKMNAEEFYKDHFGHTSQHVSMDKIFVCMELYVRHQKEVQEVGTTDDGVCDGEYTHPTQGEIIAFNRGESQGILRSMELLEKLKDFYYWKEWKNK